MNDENKQNADLAKTDNQESDNYRKANGQSSEKSKSHPIAVSVDKLITRITDIKLSVNQFIAQAEKWLTEEEKAITRSFDKIITSLKTKEIRNRAPAIKNLVDTTYRLKRMHESELLNILLTGYLLTMFSSFDAFIGDLLESIYRKKPELFNQLNRSMTISEMLQYADVEDIKDIVLKSEIESFRRKSYVEQFETLENRFGLKLRSFSNWPFFVECSQRRNLFAHCDGVVSEQYITLCKNESYVFQESLKIADKIKLDANYLIASCDIIIEVGLKLGQTLWRKVFEEELEEADSHLQNVQYGFLVKEEWWCAKMAGKFAINQRSHSTDVYKTIMLVNYIIALKNCDENDKAIEQLNSQDWTALSYDFRLAAQVLHENYAEAAKIMKKIGKESDLVNEHAYHIWPLFRDFRQSEEFQECYKEIYEYDFSDKLIESAKEDRQDVEKTSLDTKTEGTKTNQSSICEKPFSSNEAQQS